MTDIPDPNNQTASMPPRPEPACALLAMCVECGQGIELALPIDHRSLAFLLAQSGWFISVMSPPGQDSEPAATHCRCGHPIAAHALGICKHGTPSWPTRDGKHCTCRELIAASSPRTSSPPEVPMVLGPLCTACAQQVYPPEVFAAAEQRRQQLLQAAQAARGAAR